MRSISINWQTNTFGKDPTVEFYAAINRTYPTLGLTAVNSKIALVINCATAAEPDQAIAKLYKTNDPTVIYEFLFIRKNINTILSTPVLTPANLTAIASLTSSEELLKFIAQKYNRAWTEKDFWVSRNEIEDAGGQVRPNWLMRARYDSLAWCGEKIVWLHPGP